MNADLPLSVGHGHRFVEIEPSPATPSVTCPQGAELRFRGLHRQARVRGYQVRPAARLSSEGAAISTPQLDHLSSIRCRSGDVPRSNSPGGLAGKYSSYWPGHLRRRGLASPTGPSVVMTASEPRRCWRVRYGRPPEQSWPIAER